MRTRLLLVCTVLLMGHQAPAQEIMKVYETIRTEKPPRIDGDLDEPQWQNAPAMVDYFQYLPTWGTVPDHPMDVRIMYDDEALYIGALLYDSAPDSIKGELGARDANDINADFFRICIDTYNKRQDAYYFGVYASGVQFESKVSDATFDAVWESATKITRDGWSAEIKIPYSAIRFPKREEQEWGLQVNRSVRRTREFTQWSKVPNNTNNIQLYWGVLKGIKNVNAPLRLSFTPYISAYIENGPVYDSEGNTEYTNTFSYNAGADVKFGIDERFTLDMTLLPDFGQVQSDNKVKNLSYREVTYDENRPFFKESVELFDKLDLFYSRRIGKIPSGYFSVEGDLQQGETLEENPSSAKLMNALKISGRTDDGLGIGFFNAVTDNTYARIKDASGNSRRVLTEPLTNYNVLVFDQHLKNNSNVYFINTNVTRDKQFNDGNVSGTGFTISNKKNTFAVEGSGALSQQFARPDSAENGNYNTTLGYMYELEIEKLGGRFEYGISRKVIDDNYYTSDLGYQVINSRNINHIYFRHNMNEPWKFLRNSYNGTGYTYATHFQTGKPVINEVYLNLFATLLNYHSAFGGVGFTPGEFYDYFEPRTEGRYNKAIGYYYTYFGISSDYRKPVAIDLNLNLSNFRERFVSEGYNVNLRPRYRISDKFTVRLESYSGFDPYNLGYADTQQDGTIIYGLRRLNTYINQLNFIYTFNPDFHISMNARHYWITAQYRKYLTLEEDGDLSDNFTYSENNDFSYNAFNIDLLCSWQFSPGSNLSVVYKNIIENDNVGITQIPEFGNNFKNMIRDPQTNSISVKLLYYLDYQYFRKHLKKK